MHGPGAHCAARSDIDIVEVTSRPVLEAAPLLLGAVIWTEIDRVRVAVELNEVEAYGGATDPASHAHRGRTTRNLPMFAAPGTLYVYRSYGIHWCVNVSCGPEGEASAVLLRGGCVVEGQDAAIHRRGRGTNLADGPGKLCQALAITGDLTGTQPDGVSLGFTFPDGRPAHRTTPRIGISKAVERRWRFVTDSSERSRATA